MSRITKKRDGFYYDIDECMVSNCSQKLGLLEDIEEELGIDLIKVVELCKQVNSKKLVYIKDDDGIYPIEILDDLDVELFNHRLYSNSRGTYVSLDLYEYGKEWALDKSDLVYDIVKKE